MPMSKKDNPPPFILQYDSASTSSEEDSSSSEDGEAPQVQDRSVNHNVDSNSSFEPDEVPKEQDRGKGHNKNGKERVDPLDKTALADDSEGHRDFPQERDLIRKVPKPTSLTTAQRRTMINMFGVTNTEYTQTAITDPVLYVALYSTGEAPSEVDDYHWAFIVGPSHEEADSKGTLYNMEPRQALNYDRPCCSEWQWLYNQPTISLRGQDDLLVRLMIAEVADMNSLQATVLRWGESITMREHVEWMSVKWLKNVLKDLEKEGGCLGRRMENFESVEAEGRSLAETEEEKRKGFCLLHRRVSTRTLFEREGATALPRTATADIAINYPVLYVGVYSSDHAPYEDGQYHWAFLIGPSDETTRSEGVCCGMDFQLDSTGQPTRIYNQTTIPLRKVDDLLMRRLVAEIVDLGALGKIIRDQKSTSAAESTGSMAEDPGWTSLAWVREKLERLERELECSAYKSHDFSMIEWIGMKVAKSSDQKWKNSRMPVGTETLCLVSGWKKPDDDEVAVLVKLDPVRGKPDTISSAIQIITGVLGVAVLGLRRQVAEKDKRELEDKQSEVAIARSKRNNLVTTLAEATKPQDLSKATEIPKNVEEQEPTARPESARVTTINFAKLARPERASERKLVAKEVEGNGDQSEDDEDEDEDDDEGDEESGDEEDEEDDEDEDDEDDDEDSEDDEDESEAKGNTAEKRAHARPDNVWSTTIHLPELDQPDQAAGKKNPTQENDKGKDGTEGNEEDEEEDSEEDNNEDNDSDEDEDESSDEEDESSDEEDESSDEEDDDDEEDDGDEDEGEEGENEDVEESARGQTTVKNTSTIALST